MHFPVEVYLGSVSERATDGIKCVAVISGEVNTVFIVGIVSSIVGIL